jgi:hypothetical protein
VAYTEFFVTQGTGRSAENGGGPRLGSNDGPIFTSSSATGGIAPNDDQITVPGGWPGTIVGDWVTFKWGGTNYHTAIITKFNAALGNVAFISPKLPAGAQGQLGSVRVGGAWDNLQNAFARLATPVASAPISIWSTSSHTQRTIPRINVKYDAAAYTISAGLGPAQWGTWPAGYGFRIEGYEKVPGDLRSDDPRTSTRFPKLDLATPLTVNPLDIYRGVLACLEISRAAPALASAVSVVRLSDSGETSAADSALDRCRIIANGNTGLGACYAVDVACVGAKLLDSYIRRNAGVYNNESAGVRINSAKNNVHILGCAIEGPSEQEGAGGDELAVRRVARGRRSGHGLGRQPHLFQQHRRRPRRQLHAARIQHARAQPKGQRSFRKLGPLLQQHVPRQHFRADAGP